MSEDYRIIPSYAGGYVGRWYYVIDSKLDCVLSRHTNLPAAKAALLAVQQRQNLERMERLQLERLQPVC